MTLSLFSPDADASHSNRAKGSPSLKVRERQFRLTTSFPPTQSDLSISLCSSKSRLFLTLRISLSFPFLDSSSTFTSSHIYITILSLLLRTRLCLLCFGSRISWLLHCHIEPDFRYTHFEASEFSSYLLFSKIRFISRLASLLFSAIPRSSLAQLMSLKMASTKRSIVMAVDFGTTYSGVAWAQTSNVSTFPAETLPPPTV